MVLWFSPLQLTKTDVADVNIAVSDVVGEKKSSWAIHCGVKVQDRRL